MSPADLHNELCLQEWNRVNNFTLKSTLSKLWSPITLGQELRAKHWVWLSIANQTHIVLCCTSLVWVVQTEQPASQPLSSMDKVWYPSTHKARQRRPLQGEAHFSAWNNSLLPWLISTWFYAASWPSKSKSNMLYLPRSATSAWDTWAGLLETAFPRALTSAIVCRRLFTWVNAWGRTPS